MEESIVVKYGGRSMFGKNWNKLLTNGQIKEEIDDFVVYSDLEM